MGFLSVLTERFQAELERQRNRPFLRASMAACALVAAADGEVSLGERVRVDQILETLESLRVFDPHEGVDLFNGFSDAILQHPKEGHASALQLVLDFVEGEPTTAHLLIRVCLAVSEANGEKNLADQIEIVSLCSQMGIDPETVGLYTPDSLVEESAKHS
ncbi:tellurite resistance TerB family protein [Magnetospira sp. QH-2]|uniref:tellurite resistance TerB family protein n=1 Tax=Magnetospira sp. (strain QH-2) TaxID=1288970 RepID=UPI0003E80CA3|nr:TerB family tellurite resistance protein [Magnetospira sp. QH-2]CCQ74696.1 putative tellurite resistance TerB [Magnetospira sp. QH-2]